MPKHVPIELKTEARRLREQEHLSGPVIAKRLSISRWTVYGACKGLEAPTRAQMFDAHPSMVTWTPLECTKLERAWPTATWAKLRELFPNRASTAITKQAQKQGLQRTRRATNRKRHQVDPVFKALRDIREVQKIGREELSHKLGYHRVYVARCELGDNVPSWPMFRAWLGALGCDIQVIGPKDGD